MEERDALRLQLFNKQVKALGDHPWIIIHEIQEVPKLLDHVQSISPCILGKNYMLRNFKPEHW